MLETVQDIDIVTNTMVVYYELMRFIEWWYFQITFIDPSLTTQTLHFLLFASLFLSSYREDRDLKFGATRPSLWMTNRP